MSGNKSGSGARKWPPRIVIAAPQGRSGKTIVSIGLCAAFRRQGLVVQPFKKGPDYIDPSWLTVAAGRGCYNLDTVLTPKEILVASFQRVCLGADVAIIEGAMGLYDGCDSNGWGSTAQVARLVHCPVILVVNTSRMARSIAAMIGGYQRFEPETGIAGVILNNVSNSRHEQKLANAVEKYCGIPVVGSVPRDQHLGITQRHLGLVPFPEAEEAESIIGGIERTLEGCFDLNRILAIARSAEAVHAAELETLTKKRAPVKIGVVRDHIFSFYYRENLEALIQAGAELIFIDSLKDQDLPDIDGLYIGGGFPELFLKELEANFSLRRCIAQAIEDYLPVYAECAGLMYLSRSIRWHNKQFEMVGAIPAEIELCPRPQGHGYVTVDVINENPLFPVGFTFWGHEFHHSKLSIPDGFNFAYRVRRGRGIDGQVDGIVYKNVLAVYTHLYALGVPDWAEAFVSLAMRKQQPSLSASHR